MRIYKIRFDVLICMLLSALTVFGTVKILPAFYSMQNDRYMQKHQVADGDIGGKAGEDVYLAQSVEEILTHDTFTVKASYSSVVSADNGFFGDYYLLNLELPSGERVAACINTEATQRNYDEDYYILPVGKVVEADLSTDSEFLKLIERSDKLSRTDFYLDMNGNSSTGVISPEGYDDQYTIYIKSVVAVLSFIIFHVIGCKMGLFPSFLPKKNRNRE